MKIKLLSIVLFCTLFFSCSNSDDANENRFDGSIEDIRDFYNDDLVDALEDLGFLINTGNTPPNLEGNYLINRALLEASTVVGDSQGDAFPDYVMAFKNQDNNKLTIDFNGNHIGFSQKDEGAGAFISGFNNEFSMFLITSSQIDDSVIASTALAISGRVVENGIEDIQLAFMMLDNNGNPDGVYIPNNTGRLIYDSNNFSEKQ